MIYAYTGKTGSGKTFNMARDAYKRWRRGEDLYTNTYFTFIPKELYNCNISIKLYPRHSTPLYTNHKHLTRFFL